MAPPVERMRLEAAAQLRQLFLFFLWGVALGFGYDLLWLLRCRRRLAAAADAAFVLVSGLLLFRCGLAAPEGSLRGYMAAGCALGFFLWRRSLSVYIINILDVVKIKARSSRAAAGLCRLQSLFLRRMKKGFSKAQKWFTIITESRRRSQREKGRRHTAYEAAQGKSVDTAGYTGVDFIRGHQSGTDAE